MRYRSRYSVYNFVVVPVCDVQRMYLVCMFGCVAKGDVLFQGTVQYKQCKADHEREAYCTCPSLSLQCWGRSRLIIAGLLFHLTMAGHIRKGTAVTTAWAQLR